MAHPSVVINSVTYQNVPEIQIPKSGSGTASFYDASECDVVASNVLTGKVFVGASGQDTGRASVFLSPISLCTSFPAHAFLS